MNMQTGQLNLSRLLPKTGQVFEYQHGDDGYSQTGWWKGKKDHNNKTRFVVKTISEVEVILDRATGLMWPRDVSGPGSDNGSYKLWDIHISYAHDLDFAGFTDWRMPNVNELFTLADKSFGTPCWPPIFQNPINEVFWTSTTAPTSSAIAMCIQMLIGLSSSGIKVINEYYLLCVRGGL